MSFWDHLDEYVHLIRIIIALVLTFVGLMIIPKIFDSIILVTTSSDFVTYRFFEKEENTYPFCLTFQQTHSR